MEGNSHGQACFAILGHDHFLLGTAPLLHTASLLHTARA